MLIGLLCDPSSYVTFKLVVVWNFATFSRFSIFITAIASMDWEESAVLISLVDFVTFLE